MQAGGIAVHVIATALALFGQGRRAIIAFGVALAISGHWLHHHMSDPLAIAPAMGSHKLAMGLYLAGTAPVGLHGPAGTAAGQTG